jgi:hypothetical protein
MCAELIIFEKITQYPQFEYSKTSTIVNKYNKFSYY